MDFQDRLQKAVERGQHAAAEHARAAADRAVSEEECKRLHLKYRLELSEYLEQCLRQLPQHFPGFRFETLMGDRGWGAAVTRDDLRIESGRRASLFSRLEMTVRPYSPLRVLELTAKGTIHNKEVFNRDQYQMLSQVDLATFKGLIDHWVLEYAELFARSN